MLLVTLFIFLSLGRRKIVHFYSEIIPLRLVLLWLEPLHGWSQKQNREKPFHQMCYELVQPSSSGAAGLKKEWVAKIRSLLANWVGGSPGSLPYLDRIAITRLSVRPRIPSYVSLSLDANHRCISLPC